ncbi:hypothetical protein EXS72_00620 [Candidatus Pacearchaeota archaeon]|nr:hypothetical protein [Candidatus Pacearchaeota archaeon]
MNVMTFVGWIGAAFLLIAYFLLIHKDLTSRSKMYQWLNIIGSLLLAGHTFVVSAYPSFVTNAIWLLVALYGMFHAVKYHKSIKKK